MKIVHVSHLYHPSEGGVQFWFKNISERLVRDYGDEVTVVTTDSMFGPERSIYEKVEPSREIINGVEVLRFKYKRWHIPYYKFAIKAINKLRIKVPHRLRLVAAGPVSKSMKQYLMQTDADAICASASNYYFMQLPLWRKCNFFYFGSIHLSEDETKPILNETQARCINASTMYLANTIFEKRRLVKAGINADKIKVLGVGVDEQLFDITADEKASYKESLSIPADALVIGYAGRIEKTKSIKLLVESFEKIAMTNSSVYLLIAGSGSNYINELQDYTLQLDIAISDRIKWKINFNMAEKAAIFHTMDILVLPSSNESFGIVFLEAWICKKPVIGAAIGAVKDVINENEDGLLMDINSSSSLTLQLQKLIQDESLRTTLGENGYKKVIENYTWDIITKRLRQYYINSISTSNISTTSNLKLTTNV